MNFQNELDRVFSEPQSHVVLRMRGQFTPHELEQLSSKFFEPLFCGYYFNCWADVDSGVGYVHFRDHSFGTKLLPPKKIQAIKEVFSKALSSDEASTWELQAFDSLRAAHAYIGWWVRS
jgi:hypothetical protein